MEAWRNGPRDLIYIVDELIWKLRNKIPYFGGSTYFDDENFRLRKKKNLTFSRKDVADLFTFTTY